MLSCKDDRHSYCCGRHKCPQNRTIIRKCIGSTPDCYISTVAFIALVTVMIAFGDSLVGPDGKNLPAGKIYGNGIGNFLALIIGQENLKFAITFGAMAFSTFVFDTLDVTMRLGRYLVQELIGIADEENNRLINLT